MKVLLVEDSPLLTQRLAELLDELPGVDLINVVETETAALAAMQLTDLDVILLDLHLKQGTGFGVLRAMGQMSAKPCVIVLTNYDLPEYKRASLSMGASYFLDKALDLDRLAGIFREVTRARSHLTH